MIQTEETKLDYYVYSATYNGIIVGINRIKTQ